MKQIEQFYSDAKGSFDSFFDNYVEHCFDLMKAVDLNSVDKLIDSLIIAREKGSTVFIIGNGGSASLASHFAQDLALGTKAGEKKPLRALSLCDNVSYISALGNDESYENIFTGQLRNLYKPGDLLIVFSGSGNSPNLLRAIEYVNNKGGETWGVLGFDGGEAKKICKQFITITSPKGHYGPVESLHAFLTHAISNYLYFKLNDKVGKS